MKMSKLYFIVLIGFVLYIDCGHVPSTHYYQIDYQLTPPENISEVIPVTIGIERIGADAIYQDDKIVYRHSPYEVQFYHYRRWIAPPRKLVREKIIEQFRSSGTFHRVVDLPGPYETDYILRGKIKAFEEWDEKERWFGLVSLSLELEETSTGTIIWQNVLSEKQPATDKEPVEVVKALSTGLKNILQSALQEIQQNLKNR